MKTFNFNGTLGMVAITLLLGTSCSKSFDEQAIERTELKIAESSSCLNDLIINLRMSPGNATSNYFFVGEQNVVANRQAFAGTDFSENKFFDVTAVGGTAFHDLANAALGVTTAGEGAIDARSINPGEELWFTLNSNWSDYRISGFQLILWGNSSTTGRIECYNGGDLVATVPVSGPNPTAENFSLDFLATTGISPTDNIFFNQVRFICDAGRFIVRGNQFSSLPSPKYFMVNTARAVYMRNQHGRTPPSPPGTGILNRYINEGKWPNEANISNRQYKSQLPNLEPGSGDYNHTNADKWLKIRAVGGSLVFDGTFMIGVGNMGDVKGNIRSLQLGESITIEPGHDFPSGYFSALEFRESTFIGSKLDWKAYNGATLVASGTTTGVTQTYNFINPGVKFNKVVLSGVSPTARAAIGNRGDQIISAYPFCKN